MIKKGFSALFFIGLITVGMMSSCKEEHVVVDFSISPATPKAGESISFTNKSVGDGDWKLSSSSWRFGDGSTSSYTNPTYTYQKPGTYTVTLKVNNNDDYVVVKHIIVYDSVPSILCDVEEIGVFQYVSFSSVMHVPSNQKVNYEWFFSENAVGESIVDGKSTEEEVRLLFTKNDVEETIKVRIYIENYIDTIIQKTVYIHDVKARGLLMAEKGGNILRQRIYANGIAEPASMGIPAGSYPFNIQIAGDRLYVFDAGDVFSTNTAMGDGSIRMTDLSDNVSVEIINNNGRSLENSFFNGYVDDKYTYWTNQTDFIFRSRRNSALGTILDGTPDDFLTAPYYFLRADRLNYFGNGLNSGQLNGGIYIYKNIYFWAKGGTGKGIYRFAEDDILTETATGSPLPEAGAILTDRSIRAFTIDEVNQKIYFSSVDEGNFGFFVADIDGSNVQKIDDAPVDNDALYITGIEVDNTSNKVYWAYRSPETVGSLAPDGFTSWDSYYEVYPTHRTGIKAAQLAVGKQPAGSVGYLAVDIAAYGLTLDGKAR